MIAPESLPFQHVSLRQSFAKQVILYQLFHQMPLLHWLQHWHSFLLLLLPDTP
jgi:hypothetical protein